jgi:hypothetical protein
MREVRGLRRRVRGRGIADPDPSKRTGILLDPPGYLNCLPTARWAARRPDANFALREFSELRLNGVIRSSPPSSEKGIKTVLPTT